MDSLPTLGRADPSYAQSAQATPLLSGQQPSSQEPNQPRFDSMGPRAALLGHNTLQKGNSGGYGSDHSTGFPMEYSSDFSASRYAPLRYSEDHIEPQSLPKEPDLPMPKDLPESDSTALIDGHFDVGSEDESDNGADETVPRLESRLIVYRQRHVRLRRGCFGLWHLLRRLGLMGYLTFHFAYFFMLGFTGTLLLYLLHDNLSPVDSLFMAFSAVSLAGLSVVDVYKMNVPCQVVLLLCMELGGVVISTIPALLVRRYFLDRAHREIKAETAMALQFDVAASRYFGRLDINHHEDLGKQQNIEYRAMTLLMVHISVYLVLVQSVCFLILGTYLSTGGRAQTLLSYPGGQVNPWFFALFTSVSAFVNCGMCQLPNSLENFATRPTVLLPVVVTIMLGNTAYPMALRLMVKMSARIFLRIDGTRTVLCNFLLSKSRSIYTHLFTAEYTSVLAMFFVVILFGETCLFLLTERQNAVLGGYSEGNFLLAALFCAASTRSAGMNSFDMRTLGPGMQCVVVVLMYVVAYPLLFVIRRSDTSRRNQRVEYLRLQAAEEGNLVDMLQIKPRKADMVKRRVRSKGHEYERVVKVPAPYVSREAIQRESSEPASISSVSRRLSHFSPMRAFAPSSSADDTRRQSRAGGYDLASHTSQLAPSSHSSVVEDVEAHPPLDEETAKMWDAFMALEATLEDDMQRSKFTATKRPRKNFFQNMMGLFTDRVIFRDATYVTVAIVLICFLEGRTLSGENTVDGYSIWAVIFEVVSGYGTVGYSLGFPGMTCSFSGALKKSSKLVIVAICLLGRHRGLPASDDPAVVPSNYKSLRAYRQKKRELLKQLEEKHERQEVDIMEDYHGVTVMSPDSVSTHTLPTLSTPPKMKSTPPKIKSALKKGHAGHFTPKNSVRSPGTRGTSSSLNSSGDSPPHIAVVSAPSRMKLQLQHNAAATT